MKNIVLNDFHNVDFSRLGKPLKNKLPMIVIYKNPKDYPNNHVARLWIAGGSSPIPTLNIVLADSLEEVRKSVLPGMVRFERDISDDPVVVETWL
jgi:hypothetical protein